MVKSLVEICASKIITDYQKVKEAVASIPQELFHILLAVAIREDKTPATKLLVTKWPYRVLNLLNLAQHTSYPEPIFSVDDVKSGIIITILIAVAGSEECKAELTDLNGVILGLHKTTSCFQVLLNGCKKRSSKCTKQRKLIFPWTVGKENFVFVSKCLRKLENSGIHVICSKLNVEGLSHGKIAKLLSVVDSEGIHSLSLRLNSLGNDGMIEVLPHINQFQNLQSLDLSYNIVDLSKRTVICKRIKDTFGSLPKLQDINLSYNRITGGLQSIIGSLNTPVRCLKLERCFLSAGDLSYMSNTMNTSKLEVLDLSGNNLSSCLDILEKLLMKSCHSLVELHLDCASLSENDLSKDMLNRLAAKYTKLQCFSIPYNGFSQDDQVAIATAYSSIRAMFHMEITGEHDEMGWDESE